jgi:hypothetical protein
VKLCLFGYLVLLAIVGLSFAAPWADEHWYAQGAAGGAFLAFVVVAPSYIALMALDRARRAYRVRRGAGSAASSVPQEETPASDEEVPPHPQPQSERDVSGATPPGETRDQVPDPRVVEQEPAQFPDHERAQQDAPPDGSTERSDRVGSDRRVRVGLLGWALILSAGTAWELLSLFTPWVHTLSQPVHTMMQTPPGRVGAFATWVVLGYLFFASSRSAT